MSRRVTWLPFQPHIVRSRKYALDRTTARCALRGADVRQELLLPPANHARAAATEQRTSFRSSWQFACVARHGGSRSSCDLIRVRGIVAFDTRDARARVALHAPDLT